MENPCPLCDSAQVNLLYGTQLLKCSECELVFRKSPDQLPANEEKYRYEQHNNDLNNPGYREFLMPVIAELQKRLAIGSMGLDYGCGPTNALAQLAQSAGYACEIYDPFFAPKDLNKFKNLDFILCTEAAEHFFNPNIEFDKIFNLLTRTGALILMTELYDGNTNFEKWYYAKDPTHVCFYSKASLNWIARAYKRQLHSVTNRLSTFV